MQLSIQQKYLHLPKWELPVKGPDHCKQRNFLSFKIWCHVIEKRCWNTIGPQYEQGICQYFGFHIVNFSWKIHNYVLHKSMSSRKFHEGRYAYFLLCKKRTKLSKCRNNVRGTTSRRAYLAINFCVCSCLWIYSISNMRIPICFCTAGIYMGQPILATDELITKR